MLIRIFTFSAFDPGIDELNAFLKSHKIVHVDQQFFHMGQGAYWSFCVTYLAQAGSGRYDRNRPRIDYKEVLKPEDFREFEVLRRIRRDLAQSDGVPPYSVFTNAELAEMVQLKVGSPADLEKISGVGQAKVEKYGKLLLEHWKNGNYHEPAE